MTSKEMVRHTEWLLNTIQKRGLDERQACAVMGYTIVSLIIGEEERMAFVKALLDTWETLNSET